MDNKKRTILTIVGISVLLIALVGATYAYFIPEITGTTTRDVSATSNTTDNLTFSISNDISFTASTTNFYEGGNNISGEATATATLTPNNKTNQATMNYNMYLNLTSNPIDYSSTNTNEDPELLLQVFDGSNQLVTLTGLGSQVTIGGLTGYDITGATGLITLLDNHTITANNATEVETWRVVITLVNLGVDQNDNGGKIVTGEIIMQKGSAEANPCADKPNDLMCYTTLNYSAPTTPAETTNLIYYHDENLEDGAEDGSYRYAGSNPNNWVCFGSNVTPCPAENLYRIIGFMPVDVVIDSTTNPETTERQMLYKLIRNDYETSTSLGITSDGYIDKCNDEYCTYDGPSGNMPNYNVEAFYWSGSDTNVTNTWGLSTLNTIGLNTTAYGEFSNTWQNKIETVMWKVGGTLPWYTYSAEDAPTVYSREITYSGININNEEDWYGPEDNKMEIPNKIGMLYISDYVYAQPQSTWTTADPMGRYGSGLYNSSTNWLYRGASDWTITRVTWYSSYINSIDSMGFVQYCNTVDSSTSGVRRVFYLTEDTTIDRTLHAGTQVDPYRVS